MLAAICFVRRDALSFPARHRFPIQVLLPLRWTHARLADPRLVLALRRMAPLDKKVRSALRLSLPPMRPQSRATLSCLSHLPPPRRSHGSASPRPASEMQRGGVDRRPSRRPTWPARSGSNLGRVATQMLDSVGLYPIYCMVPT